ncbi:hypothetical protein D3C76_1336510 [compost metagenome]
MLAAKDAVAKAQKATIRKMATSRRFSTMSLSGTMNNRPSTYPICVKVTMKPDASEVNPVAALIGPTKVWE